MGQYLSTKTIMGVTCLAGLLTLSTSASLTAPAEARIPGAQTSPVFSANKPLARDADTFESDKTLEATCRKSGQAKAICLCVIHITKYELTLSEYRAAVRLYGQPTNRADLRETLRVEGYTPSEIRVAEKMERSLTEDRDFASRCSEAKAYYKSSAN